jgi:hypothetical protein
MAALEADRFLAHHERSGAATARAGGEPHDYKEAQAAE